MRRLYLGVEKSLPFIPLVPALFVAALWRQGNPSLLLAWLAGAMVLLLWQFLLVRAYRSRPPSPDQAASWGVADDLDHPNPSLTLPSQI